MNTENILIAQDGYLKLIDFRFAKKVIGRTFTLCGTHDYLAPEIILNQGYKISINFFPKLGYSKPVDWWTLGILIYEMISGKLPFSHTDPI